MKSVLHGLEASTDLTKPVFASLQPLTVVRIGRERLKVPAGDLATTHFQITGVNEIWITDEDRLVIKSAVLSRDLQNHLIEASGAPR